MSLFLQPLHMLIAVCFCRCVEVRDGGHLSGCLFWLLCNSGLAVGGMAFSPPPAQIPGYLSLSDLSLQTGFVSKSPERCEAQRAFGPPPPAGSLPPPPYSHLFLFITSLLQTLPLVKRILFASLQVFVQSAVFLPFLV